MSDKHAHADMRRLWQNQAVESNPMSLDDLRNRLSKLNRTVRFRTLAMGLSCLLLAAGFGPAIFIASNSLTRVSAFLFFIGGGYLLYRVVLGRWRGSSQLLSRGEPEACAAFYRSELERQRNFHRRVGIWLMPVGCAPVAAFFLEVRQFTTWQFTVTMVVLAAFLIVVGVVGNLWRASEYHRELNELKARSEQ